MSFIEDSTAEFTDGDVHLRDAMKLSKCREGPEFLKCLTKSC